MEKIISIRLNENALNELEVIKQDVARFFKTSPDQITNTQCIKYAIGTLSDMIREENNKTTG